MRGWVIAIALGGCAPHAAAPRAPHARGLAPSARPPVVPALVAAPRPARDEARVAPPTAARRRPEVATSDGDVVRALDRAQPSFLRCFRKARRVDPALMRATVTVQARLTLAGQLEAVRAEAPTAALGACVRDVARTLRLPRPTSPRPIVLPLRFAAPT